MAAHCPRSLALTLIVHPESATLVYAGDNFCSGNALRPSARAWRRHSAGSRDRQRSRSKLFIATFSSNGPPLLVAHSISGTTRQAFDVRREQKKFSAIVSSPSASSPQVSIRQTILRPTRIHASGRNAPREEPAVIVIADRFRDWPKHRPPTNA